MLCVGGLPSPNTPCWISLPWAERTKGQLQHGREAVAGRESMESQAGSINFARKIYFANLLSGLTVEKVPDFRGVPLARAARGQEPS